MANNMSNSEITKVLNSMEKHLDLLDPMIEENKAEGNTLMVKLLTQHQTRVENQVAELEDQYDENLHIEAINAIMEQDGGTNASDDEPNTKF